MRRMLAVGLGIVGAVSPFSAGSASADYTCGYASATEVTTPAGLFYVAYIDADDPMIPVPSVLIYQESNNVTGLQRGGYGPLGKDPIGWGGEGPTWYDTCENVDHDSLIF